MDMWFGMTGSFENRGSGHNEERGSPGAAYTSNIMLNRDAVF